MDFDDEYADIPDDPQLAFVYLESHYKAAMNRDIAEAENNSSCEAFYIQYINKTTAAARVLDLDILQNWAAPSRSDNNIWNDYVDFCTHVEHYIEQIKIYHARRRRQYSVAFDGTTKAKIRHLLGQVKEIVDRLEVEERKREALYNGINTLLSEVDRNRTRFEAYACLAIEAAAVGDKAVTPITKLLDSIAGLFGKAKDAENAVPQLPSPPPIKRIEGPKADNEKPQNTAPSGWESPANLDDDIPF